MRKIWSVAIVVAVALAIAPLAKADTFTYDLSGALNGTFTVSGTDWGSGVFNITSGTLTIAGFGTFNLFANSNTGNPSYSPSGAFIFDDLLLPGAATAANGTALDLYGLLFTSSTGIEWNLWGNGLGTKFTIYEWVPGFGYQIADVGNISLTPVPEPGSLLLLGSGLALLAFVLWRKARKREETSMSSLQAA